MANLILPRRFTQQPQGPVEVDWNHELLTTCHGVFSGRALYTKVAPPLPADFDTVSPSGIVGSTTGIYLPELDNYVVNNDKLNLLSCNTLAAHIASYFPFAGWHFYTYPWENQQIAHGGWTTDNASYSRVNNDVGQANYTDSYPITDAVYDFRINGASTNLLKNGTSVVTGTSSTAWSIDTRKRLLFTYASWGFVFADSGDEFRNRELRRNPWQIFKAQPQRLYFDVAAGGITGTGALTTSTTTASGAGSLTHTGTGALTASAITLSGAGVLTHTGTGALTTSAITADGTGTVTGVGTVTGTGALTVSAVTASGAGIIGHTGTGALSVSVVTMDGAGVLTHTGTGALTTGQTTLEGSGVVIGTITGTGALTTSNVTVSGYDVLATAGGGIGHGGFARKPRLIKVEEAENPEEVIAQIEAEFAETPKKRGRKLKAVVETPRPNFPPKYNPQPWLDYYEQQAKQLREQQAMADLMALARLRIQELQEAETLRRLEEYQAKLQQQQEEEELLLLLMAA